jgi:hypothetical protein
MSKAAEKAEETSFESKELEDGLQQHWANIKAEVMQVNWNTKVNIFIKVGFNVQFITYLHMYVGHQQFYSTISTFTQMKFGVSI